MLTLDGKLIMTELVLAMALFIACMIVGTVFDKTKTASYMATWFIPLALSVVGTLLHLIWTGS